MAHVLARTPENVLAEEESGAKRNIAAFGLFAFS